MIDTLKLIAQWITIAVLLMMIHYAVSSSDSDTLECRQHIIVHNTIHSEVISNDHTGELFIFTYTPYQASIEKYVK